MTLLSYQDLKAKGVPYTLTHLNRLMKSGEFPQKVKLGTSPNARNAWVDVEVNAWIESRMAQRGSHQ